MIAAARLSAIITTEAHHVRLSGQTRNLLSFEDLIRPHPGSAAPVECRSDDIAYMMFTSGSTGEPKAVLVTHGNLVASTAARTKWYDAQPTAYLLLSSHSFDSSVAGIYWTLTAGGTLCIPDAEEARTIASIADMLRSWSITHTLCLPSLYRVLLDTAADTLTDLQTVIVAGEATTRELIAEHRASGIEARLVNEYGPTEATVWCAAADLTDTPADAEVAIGGPIPGCILRVRDAQGAPVPPGLPGELLVGGPGVAAGYFDLETETRARFVTEPDGMRLYRTGDIVREAADGALIYIGRSDGQVKIRGYRVELSEIEKVLAARPDVREAAVAVFGSGPDARLVGFVQGKGGTAIQPEDLSGTCREALPAYMIPSRFVLLDQMPRTPNGKIDRNALPEPAFAPPAATSVLPSTMTESVLAEIWRTTLWLDREIGITEDFHDLGGHSLIAIRLLNEIQETFDIRLPASSLGRITTVEEQAKLIETARREGGLIVRDTPAARTSEVLSGLSDDDEAKLVAMVSNWRAPAARDGFKIRAANEGGSLSPLFFCFLDEYSFNQLADALGPDQPIYCIRGSNGVVPMSGEEAFQDNMRRTALSYLPEVLELAGDRPILLGGYCQGALVALNIAAFLTALQRDVATVIAIEHVPTIRFPGHVDILCGDQSFLNPYRQFAAPERAWERRYGSYTFELIPGEYQKAFHPQYIVEFAASIRKRMAEARTRAMPALARAARSVTWGDPPDIGAIHPGDMRTIEIRLRNTGTMPWPASQESGLRLRARWSAEAGADVPGEDSHAGFARPVAPGAWTSIPIEIRAPVTLGFHRLEIDMIEEGIAAFSKMGNDILKLPVSVDPSAPRTAAPATPQEASALDPLHDLVAAFSQATEEAAARGTRWAKPDAALTRDLVASLRNLGVFHLRGNRLGEAQRALASALEIDPADGRSLVALARVRLAQRRFLSAQAMIWRARKTDPDSAMEAAALQALRLSPRSFARFVRDWLRAASAGAQSKSDR
jgi:amino acid adenylation domain-containing protein